MKRGGKEGLITEAPSFTSLTGTMYDGENQRVIHTVDTRSSGFFIIVIRGRRMRREREKTMREREVSIGDGTCFFFVSVVFIIAVAVFKRNALPSSLPLLFRPPF